MKLKQEELEKFQSFTQDETKLMSYLGQINYQKLLLEIDEDSIKEEIKNISTQKREYSKELSEIYGEGSINMQTGEVTPLQ